MQKRAKRDNKKSIILIILVLVVVGGLAAYFLTQTNTRTTNRNDNIQAEVTPPILELVSSTEAIAATSEAAKSWASDAKLYDCSGLTISSLTVSRVKFTHLGANKGSYNSWICTYYSASKGQTNIYKYKKEKVAGGDEPVNIGKYSDTMYNSIKYPSNLSSLKSSNEIFQNAVNKGLDADTNFVNMYLTNTQDYGYVWKLDERSKTEVDEYEIGLLINSYIFDSVSGSLKTISKTDIY